LVAEYVQISDWWSNTCIIHERQNHYGMKLLPPGSIQIHLSVLESYIKVHFKDSTIWRYNLDSIMLHLCRVSIYREGVSIQTSRYNRLVSWRKLYLHHPHRLRDTHIWTDPRVITFIHMLGFLLFTRNRVTQMVSCLWVIYRVLLSLWQKLVFLLWLFVWWISLLPKNQILVRINVERT
jgi:hypothetical protein